MKAQMTNIDFITTFTSTALTSILLTSTVLTNAALSRAALTSAINKLVLMIKLDSKYA